MSSFVSFVKAKLDESKDLFGTYHYHDKGPDEVLSMYEITQQFNKLHKDEMIAALHELLEMDHDLSTDMIVSHILGSVDGDSNFDFLFEDEKLMEHY